MAGPLIRKRFDGWKCQENSMIGASSHYSAPVFHRKVSQEVIGRSQDQHQMVNNKKNQNTNGNHL